LKNNSARAVNPYFDASAKLRTADILPAEGCGNAQGFASDDTSAAL
jgi:hypothetical protein